MKGGDLQHLFSNIIYENEIRISRLMISRDCSSTVYGQVMSLFLLFILKASIINTFTGTCIYSRSVSVYLDCKGIESDKTSYFHLKSKNGLQDELEGWKEQIPDLGICCKLDNDLLLSLSQKKKQILKSGVCCKNI